MKKLFSLFTISFILINGLNAQNYCTPSYYGANPPASRFQTHILRFSLGELNDTRPDPVSATQSNYENRTTYSTDLVVSHTYPLRVKVGHGAYTQTVAVWIDYNQNQVFEASERLFAETDTGSTSDHMLRSTITIPVNATLGQTRLRVGTVGLGIIPDPCVNNHNENQHFIDYTVNIIQPDIQSYISTNAYHETTDEVTRNSFNNLILRVEVNTNTAGTLSPLLLDTMFFSTLGTTNPIEITNAKLFYTGKSPEFTTTNQVGSMVSSPPTYFNIYSNTSLQPGRNYFWLTYDISATAIIGNAIDARCTGVKIKTKRIPSLIAPGNNRKIGYCVSKGNKSQFVYDKRVILGTIDNAPGYWGSYYSTTGYGNYLNMSTTLTKGVNHQLSIETGNGVNDNFIRAWIDFNQDGIFDNVNELVLFDSLLGLTQTNPSYGPVTSNFTVPFNSPCGVTRMRVTSHFRTQTRIPAHPCENPVDIGEVEDYTIIIADTGFPIADFTNNIACLGDTTFFTDQSYTLGTYQVNSWSWDFGDATTSTQQNPTHVYANPGVYNVKLVANTNYPSSIFSVITKSVKVNAPVADFSFSSNLYQTQIRFADETSGGLAVDWDWNFGDSASGWQNISKNQFPSHIFDTVGTYNVMFVVTTEGGCIDTIIKSIFIDSIIAPVADFGASSYNPYYLQRVNLQDLSVYSPSSWRWKFTPGTVTFHDSTTATSQNPVISFNNIGTYTVELVAQNNAGADSVMRTFVTKDYSVPVTNFSASPLIVKADQLVSYLDLSTNDPSSWIWTFGDGDSSFYQHPSHTYQNVGSYSISLKADNPKGSDTKTKTSYIKVSNEYDMCDNQATWTRLFSGFIFDSGGKNGDYNDNSNCGFIIKPECAGPITLSFTAFDFAQNDYILVFDGEDNSGIKLFSHPIGISGATLPIPKIAKSGAMYIEEFTDNVSPNNLGFAAYWTAAPNIKPTVHISADTPGYNHAPVIFINTTSGYGNTYYWDYDNDNIYDDTIEVNNTNKDGYFTFDTNGIYTVKLLAENCKGTDSAYFTISITNPTSPPLVDFTTIYPEDTISFVLDNIQFKDLSTNGPTSWLWEVNPPLAWFPQGNTIKNPRIAFYEPGFYDISLTASNIIGSGTKVTKTKMIYIKEQSIMCSTVTGTYETSSPAGRIFDSGGEANNYSNGSNSINCPGFLIKPCANKVYLEFLKFQYQLNDYVRVYDGEDNTGKKLFSGNGFTSGNLPPAVLIAESGAIYIEEETNNSNTDEGFVADWSIEPISLPKVQFVHPDTSFTGGYVTYFENTTREQVDIFYWDYNYDGFFDDSTSFDGHYKFNSTGTKNIYLKAINCTGANSFISTLEIINPIQKPEADFAADRTSGDTSDVFTLKDLSKYGPNNWSWQFDPATVTYVDTTDTLFARPLIKFNNIGVYDVTLFVENTFGKDSITKTDYIKIFVYCRPTVDTMVNEFGISKVVINNLSNNSYCGIDEYTDFTSSHSVTLELGGRYDFLIQSTDAIYPFSRKIWIDYNQDGVFNDTSELAAFENNVQSTIWEDSFTVPSNALLGLTRMRIGVDYAGYPNLPCGPNYTGEFEDYQVLITPDFTSPKITLLGNKLEFTEIGYPFIDPGAIAWDAVDGDLSSQISVNSNVDTSTLGEYYVTYDVSDAASNKADRVIRNVTVSPDVTKPIITLKGDNPMTVGLTYPYIEPGATAWDNQGGDVSANIGIENPIDINRVDTYSVIYSAFDINYPPNFAYTSRTVYVVDTVAPVIYLNGPDTVIIPVGGTYVDSFGAYAIDNYYAGLDVSSYNIIDENTEGWYWDKYFASDPSGNASLHVPRWIKVGDPVSVREVLKPDVMSIYPNPSQGEFTISLDLNNYKDLSIKIVNCLGETVKEILKTNTKQDNIIVNLANESEGIYIIEANFNDKIIVKKLTLVK